MSETLRDLCIKLRASGECTHPQLIKYHNQELCTLITECQVLEKGIRKYWDKEDDTRDES